AVAPDSPPHAPPLFFPQAPGSVARSRGIRGAGRRDCCVLPLGPQRARHADRSGRAPGRGGAIRPPRDRRAAGPPIRVVAEPRRHRIRGGASVPLGLRGLRSSASPDSSGIPAPAPHTYISSAASHSWGMLRMMSPQSKAIEPEGNIVGFSKYVERACSMLSGSTFQDSVLSTTPSSRLPDDVTE